MRGRLRVWIAAAIVALGSTAAAAQVMMRPAPAPLVTAENEPWYLGGEPITYFGSFYYPAGPQVHFDPREMVRSGDYRGIPLYALTTIEPFSKVFVPLPGGLMHPYERRRSGELAGTVGSTAPSFPVVVSPDQPDPPYVPQAPAPPMLGVPLVGREAVASIEGAPSPPPPTGTTGTIPAETPWGPLTTAQKPEGLNAIFIDYRGQRWFASGSAEEIDSASFTRIGDHGGFAVYAREGGGIRTIYVQVAADRPGLVAPYSVR